MKYFLVSNMRFLGHLPEKNKVNRFEYKGHQFWSMALEDIDMFVVNTYDFDAFIIYITPEDIDKMDTFTGWRHIVIESDLDNILLKQLNTDIDLFTKVYFKKVQ